MVTRFFMTFLFIADVLVLKTLNFKLLPAQEIFN
jgi:hypothetical protein